MTLSEVPSAFVALLGFSGSYPAGLDRCQSGAWGSGLTGSVRIRDW